MIFEFMDEHKNEDKGITERDYKTCSNLAEDELVHTLSNDVSFPGGGFWNRERSVCKPSAQEQWIFVRDLPTREQHITQEEPR